MDGRSAQASFDDACRNVVAHLKEQVPFACWSVSRVDADHQVHLRPDDDTYGLQPGHALPWNETFCRHMVSGRTPRIAPDAMAVPQYAETAAAAGMRIGAYAGVPILDADGSLFGTLCGFDPETHDDDLLRHGPLLELMAGLLGRIVQVERMRDEAVDRADELLWASLHDPVTGLVGRRTFLDMLTRAAQRATDPEPRAALVLLHLDDLAAVNETFGHATGDQLVVQVAGRLTATLHPFDTVARLGDDEFAILLHDGSELDTTVLRVRAALPASIAVADASVPVTASIGVTPVDGAAPDDLLTRARAARQVAADRADDRWAVHEPARTSVGAGVPMLREPLRAAIRTGALHPAYQPIVALDDNRVVAYEALARWTHEGTPVPPDVFVPLATRTGLLPDLTDHMIHRAAGQLADWSATLGHRRLQVGVNVPPRLLLDPDFPDRVALGIRRHDLAPGQLVLEITEDALLDDLDTASAIARRLRALGVMLSLDDVGSGYASLLHLRHLPLQSAKIDRVFVDDIDTDDDARRFLGAVLTCGRDLGIHVVVEGVERVTQATVLRSLGAVYAQGHCFGRPVRPGDIDVRTETARRPSGRGSATGG
ncbi:bifunctional diguanylate cyclase/phosphodiesterase [Pseudonocardia abyssalis]|uniref:EAL domain-containing protein n=1 Tax=Pseudonocardia abyssalis TaxID=2792008 RepID=A0ABS6USD1_9PSEU|nr:EAL domain-containing protein [Pseudonocardia abyssalis]MBW0113856.1 EAL domain-containing protein [Pseudonocardia abyssalis]MBW0135147.1 EAL domain-containing protein [Pseudonocardia abyssalis]